MNVILAILIYLNILVPGNIYYQSFIDSSINTLEIQIGQIESDPVQMDFIDDVDLPLVPSLVIIDDNVG